jgi:hypothetical protein
LEGGEVEPMNPNPNALVAVIDLVDLDDNDEDRVRIEE